MTNPAICPRCGQAYDPSYGHVCAQAFAPPEATPERHPLLAERETTHGAFAVTATLAQRIKDALRAAPGYERLSSAQREALDSIAVKMARAVSGNPDAPEHWQDQQGYAELALEDIRDRGDGA